MNEHPLEERILKLVSRPGYQPVKPRLIARQLGLPKEEAHEVKRIVKRLVKRGLLEYGASHAVRPAVKDARPRVTGVFHRAEKGFGFVRLSATTPTPAPPREDVYIPADKTLDAATGDIVLVRLTKRVRRGDEQRAAGEILEILERETHQFVGEYYEQAGDGLVRIDGGVFSGPVYVGDPGAKNARPGDKVVVEMVRFPTHAHDGEGVITEVLGPRGKPGVDTLSIIREFNLPDHFSEDVLDAAREAAALFDESIPAGRRDLTDWPVITIDPIDARDFDDAISLTRSEEGHWLLGVHIADVAHFVRPGSPLDAAARERGTSVYLPDRVLPMLPEVISNHLASLQPDRVRYAMTVLIGMTAEGVRTSVETCRSAICSNRRFTYEEVDDFLARPEAWRKKLAPPVHQLLSSMHELAMLLRRRRLARGAIELNMREVKLDLDADGRVVGAHATENTESHQMIEEFMLAANEAVAETLRDRGLHFLRRIHEAPDPRKLEALTEFVHALGIDCEHLQSRFEIKQVLEQVAGRGEERAVNYAVLRSFQKAVYSPKEEGHYALASDCYCHFTSPIRRYPDLTVHRLLEAIWNDRRGDHDFDKLLALGKHCSDREQRAEAAERELTRVKLLDYLADRVGESMEAVITGVERFGFFCQGTAIPAEGLVHVQSLWNDRYDFDRETHSLVGRRAENRFRLGDLVRVEVAHVDTDRRQLNFRFVDWVKPAETPKPGRRSRKPSGQPGTAAKKATGRRSAEAAEQPVAEARKERRGPKKASGGTGAPRKGRRRGKRRG